MTARLFQHAGFWIALTAWALVCTGFGVPGARAWIIPCAVAGGTFVALAAVVEHRSHRRKP